MLKRIYYIFFLLFLFGLNTSSAATESVLLSETPLVQQTPVKEDMSYIQPKKYDDNFQERYQSSDYVYEQEQAEEGWFTRFIKWLERLVQDWFDLGSAKEASEVVSDIVDIFFVVIVILVVFFIVRTLMNGEGRWIFGRQSRKRIFKYDDVDTNIHETDFDMLIQQAAEAGQYRMAVRYQYLNMLKKLSTAEIISFDPEKTNLDYTYEIKDEAIREQFQYTSYIYNYVWYGEFEIDNAQYEKVHESFQIILKSSAA